MDQADRNVVVRVRVEPGERELDRRDAVVVAALEERRPGAGDPLGAALHVLAHVQHAVAVDQHQQLQEDRILEVAGAQLESERLGHLAVQPHEPLDAVA